MFQKIVRTTAALGVLANLGCVHLPASLVPVPPTRVAVFLRLDQSGKCVSVTQPQIFHVLPKDAVFFEVFNQDCPKDVAKSGVQLRFKEAVLEFDGFDGTCEGASDSTRNRAASALAKEARPEGQEKPGEGTVCSVPPNQPTPNFRFRSTAKAGTREGKFKYDVLVGGQVSEDPEGCVKRCY